ncbi:MAG TPA: alpha/beta hydrolase-fold protein [Parvularculaceae bacterium]|nr:alpha/beta hydrolase-fold protein [Parvularculaceae bacterium]
MKFVGLVAAALLIVEPIPVSAKNAPYVVPGAEVISLHSKETGATYKLFVERPPAAPKDGESYPVVYMLDADYSFSIVANVLRHFVERDILPPMILVGIAYPGAVEDHDVYKMNRTRDYTPTFVKECCYGPKFQAHSGGASKFADFIQNDVAPLIEKKFHGASDDRTIIGHSFGGLFAAYALMTRPQLFQRFIMVSPSLWYDDGAIWKMEEAQAKSGAHLAAHVFLSVGGVETQRMTDGIEELKKRLDVRDDKDLQVDLQIFDGETHSSIFPAAVTRGITKVFDAYPPYERE